MIPQTWPAHSPRKLSPPADLVFPAIELGKWNRDDPIHKLVDEDGNDVTVNTDAGADSLTDAVQIVEEIANG